MHSFTLKTATLAALLIAVPSAGAYARSMVGDPPTMIIDQVQGVDQGIANARQQNTITAAVAQSLHMRAVQISRAAETKAAQGDGTIPFFESQRLLADLGNLEQTLRLATGNGDYPN